MTNSLLPVLDALKRYGWTKHIAVDGSTGAMCLSGAVTVVASGLTPAEFCEDSRASYDVWSNIWTAEATSRRQRLLDEIHARLPVGVTGIGVPNWNDALERTWEEVEALLSQEDVTA